ncbi:UNVERIFIED_CONTAM: Pentatricopeptide repeat-containing protein, mitochondrial [Sesamum latifolium]|uniref:Pentatricopeptide repeat-containing protein, mitochondrial n=1 Tax=Sesamum latifolium TaxID=2727402 RepID=A0AAW2X3P4_9LAMI
MGLEADSYCKGALIDMYAKCVHLIIAKRIFDGAMKPDIVSWTALISEFAQVGLTEEAIEVFKKMQKAGIKPTHSTLGSVLRAIATISNHNYGSQVHTWAVKLGLDSNVYARSSLVNMYAKCQKMEAAKAVSDGQEEKNNMLWNALLGGDAQNGHAHEVLEDAQNGHVQESYEFYSLPCQCCQDFKSKISDSNQTLPS